jgi:hypothetical protein
MNGPAEKTAPGEFMSEFLEWIVIPAIYKKELCGLIGWQAPEDELYGYHLSARQMKVIGTWAGGDLSSAHLLVRLWARENKCSRYRPPFARRETLRTATK